MKGLDLSKFQKVGSDKHSTTLRHEGGHTLKIAHGGLSAKMRADLHKIPVKKFADGGDAEDDGVGKDFSDALKSVKDVWNQYAPPDKTPSGQDFASRYNQPSAPAQSPVVINVGGSSDADKAASAAKLGVSPQDMAAMSAIKSKEGALPSDNQAPAAQPPQAAQPAPAPQAPQTGLAPQATRAPADVAPPEPAAPEPDTAADLLPPEVTPEQAQSSGYQQSFNDYKAHHQQQFAQEDAAFAQDLNNGHIQPQTVHELFAKKDTLGKIGTIFGLMFGGMAAGEKGGPNQYLQMMQQEIRNDLDAQMQSKTNAQNFIKINQQQQLNNADIGQKIKQGQLTDAQVNQLKAETGIKAYTLSQLQANRTAFHTQAKMVAKMPEGPMKEQAKQALAMMGTAVTNENANIGDIAASKMALMSQLGGGGNTTALRMMGMDKMADDVERKTIPGIGKGQIPIPQETRDSLAAQKQYDEKAREYVDFAKKHSGNWSNMNLVDRQRVSNQGAAMAANLQSLYRNKIKGGVYKKGEQEFIEQIIPDQPAKWSASLNAIPKVEQTIRDNRNDIKNTAGSVGINYSGPQTGAGAKEGAASTSKSGKPIVFQNGKWVYK